MIFKILVPKHTEFNLPVQVEKSGLEEVCKGKDEVLAVKKQELEQLTVSHISAAG